MNRDDIVRLISDETARLHVPDHPTLTPEDEQEQYRSIVNDLIRKALNNGLQLSDVYPVLTPLSGGNTAMAVSQANINVNFVIKIDHNQKLIREARTIDDLRNDRRLFFFRHRLPIIYSQHDSQETGIYAYVMEWFSKDQYMTLTEALFGDPQNLPTTEVATKRVVDAGEALFSAYRATKDDRLEVRLHGEGYFQRLKSSLLRLREFAPSFRPVRLEVNGKAIRPWDETLDVLDTNAAKLQQLAAPFVTVVHGDPNPGNIFVGRQSMEPDLIRLIDLKDWKYGDYLFDVAKITHFLLHTGPLEELKDYANVVVDTLDASQIVVRYERNRSLFVGAAVSSLWKRTQALAAELEDPHVEQRYKLAMAANLIGLVPRRFGKNKDVAYILYCEGLSYLEEFLGTF